MSGRGPVPVVVALAPCVCLVVPVVGCASPSGSVRPAPGIELVTEADIEAVGLLREDPARGFVVVGAVRASVQTRFESRLGRARAAAEQELRRQGAMVGADAVVVDEGVIVDLPGGAIDPGLVGVFPDERNNLQRPGGSVFTTSPVKRVVVSGRAIRYSE